MGCSSISVGRCSAVAVSAIALERTLAALTMSPRVYSARMAVARGGLRGIAVVTVTCRDISGITMAIPSDSVTRI